MKAPGHAERYEPLDEDVDHERAEEPWMDAQETLLMRWRSDAADVSRLHEVAGRSARRRWHAYGLPAVLIPLVMAPLTTAMAGQWWISYLEAAGYMASAVASGAVQFLNPSAKAERHDAFSARYADLVTDIDHQLSKPRCFRQQVDTFSLKTKMMFDALNRAAPAL